MSKRNLIAIVVLFVILLGGITTTLFMLSSNQDNRSGAEGPADLITAAPTLPPVETLDEGTTDDPGPVTNVRVNYPYISGTESDWNQASCTWDGNQNATLYNVKVTDVDSSTVVKNEQLNSGVAEETFSIVDGKTYRCEVAAVSSSGVSGTPGSDEQVCESTALETTPTPTLPPEAPTPIVTEAPTPTPIVTVAPTAIPTLPPTGSIGTVATIGIGGVILMLIGGALLFL